MDDNANLPAIAPDVAAVARIKLDIDIFERSRLVTFGERRRVVIEKSGAASTVVWNPWAKKGAALADLCDPVWRGMVCVEAGNIADNQVRLAVGDGHEMSTVSPWMPDPNLLQASAWRVQSLNNIRKADAQASGWVLGWPFPLLLTALALQPATETTGPGT